MEGTGLDLVHRFGKLMADGDSKALALLYAPDAKVVVFFGVASGRTEIEKFLALSLRSHGKYEVLSIDQFQQADDVVMWDATVETETGPLQTTHVVTLDDDGLIRRHMPQ